MKKFSNEQELIKSYIVSKHGNYEEELSCSVQYTIYFKSKARMFADAYGLDNTKEYIVIDGFGYTEYKIIGV